MGQVTLLTSRFPLCISKCFFRPYSYPAYLLNLLVIIGAYVDAADYKGNTPLHIAAQYGQELLLSVLLASGADPSK